MHINPKVAYSENLQWNITSDYCDLIYATLLKKQYCFLLSQRFHFKVDFSLNKVLKKHIFSIMFLYLKPFNLFIYFYSVFPMQQ